jgi:4,5-DOPA dioxygenase extradiol
MSGTVTPTSLFTPYRYNSTRRGGWITAHGRSYDGATRFEERGKEVMRAGENRPLIAYETLGREALLSIPIPDHYLPLTYVLGTRQQSDGITDKVSMEDRFPC